MDKILSARLDEATVRQIAALAGGLHTTKKSVIERAVSFYARSLSSKENVDPLDRSFGAWARSEPAGRTVETARAAFRQSLERRQR